MSSHLLKKWKKRHRCARIRTLAKSPSLWGQPNVTLACQPCLTSCNIVCGRLPLIGSCKRTAKLIFMILLINYCIYLWKTRSDAQNRDRHPNNTSSFWFQVSLVLIKSHEWRRTVGVEIERKRGRGVELRAPFDRFFSSSSSVALKRVIYIELIQKRRFPGC